MAANMIYVTDEQWKVLSPILDELQEGGIIVPPDYVRKAEEVTGTSVADAELYHDGYDYGGQAGILVDVLCDSVLLSLSTEEIKDRFNDDELSYATDATLEMFGLERENG